LGFRLEFPDEALKKRTINELHLGLMSGPGPREKWGWRRVASLPQEDEGDRARGGRFHFDEDVHVTWEG
jgi:hypothetical protein